MKEINEVIGTINHDNVSDTVVQALKDYILENNLESGDKLPTENELSSALGISRPSIREAMKTLEGCGIIKTIHGKGRYIRDFNYDQMLDNLSYNLYVHFKDFLEVVQVRLGLETYFLPIAAERMNKEDIDRLERILLMLEREIDEGKTNSELVETHTLFHKTLYHSIDNKLLDSLISMFATFQRMMSDMNQYRTSNNDVFLQKHKELLDAIKSKDSKKIVSSLADHFTDFNDLKIN